MMRIGKIFTHIAVLLAATGAWAQDLEVIGKPVAGGMDFQPAATELMRDIRWLDGLLLWIIGLITLFVTLLLAYIIVRYNKRANPTPATFTHHSAIEVVWTVVPILILIVIGSFSLPILFKQLEIPESDLTIKVTGNQWYWTYEYIESELEFESYMVGHPSNIDQVSMSDIDLDSLELTDIVLIALDIVHVNVDTLEIANINLSTLETSASSMSDIDLKDLVIENINLKSLDLDNLNMGALDIPQIHNPFTLSPVTEVALEKSGYARDEWLLATDNAVVVPVNAVVRMQITGSDVIHSWAMPAFGVKMDAVPGRLAEIWFKAEQEGVYFGQCSELCGKDHTYMPITVKVVSQADYDAWLTGMIAEYVSLPMGVTVASVD